MNDQEYMELAIEEAKKSVQTTYEQHKKLASNKLI